MISFGWKGPQEDSTPSCLSEMEAWFLLNRLVFPTVGEAVLFWGIQNLRDLQRCPVRIGRTLRRWHAKIAEGRFFSSYAIGSVYCWSWERMLHRGSWDFDGFWLKMTHILVFGMYFNSKLDVKSRKNLDERTGPRISTTKKCRHRESSGHLVTSAPPCSHVITHQWVATSEPTPSIHDLERQ